MDPKVKAFAIQALRRASYKWPGRYKTVVAARVERGKYLCNMCKKITPKKEIQLDHIQPVVPLTGWVSFDNYIERMFVDESGFQVICKPCHDVKTQAEQGTRTQIKKENKKVIKKRRKKLKR